MGIQTESGLASPLSLTTACWAHGPAQRPLRGCLLAGKPRVRTAAPPGLSGDAGCQAPWARVQGARGGSRPRTPPLTFPAVPWPRPPRPGVCWSYCLSFRSCSYFICVYLLVSVVVQCYMRSRCASRWLDVCGTCEVISFPKCPRDTTVITGTWTQGWGCLFCLPGSVRNRPRPCRTKPGADPEDPAPGTWGPGCPAGLADQLLRLLSGSLEGRGSLHGFRETDRKLRAKPRGDLPCV